MVTSPGPEFWSSTFGVGTLDDFRTRVGPYLPDVHWFGIGPSEEDILLLAWHNPLSAAGEVAAIALAVQGIAGMGEAGTHQAVRNVAPQIQSRVENSMATLVIPNVYRCAIQATSGGQEVTNVVGLRGSSSGQEAAAAAALKAAWEGLTHPMTVLPTAYVMKSYYVMDLSSASGGITTLTSTVAGAATGSISTNGACALVKWNGGNRSRSSRGRLYYGPLAEGQINTDGRTLATATVNDLVTRFNAFRSALSSAGFTLCVISPTLSQAFDVSSVAVESVIATQRRRIRS